MRKCFPVPSLWARNYASSEVVFSSSIPWSLSTPVTKRTLIQRKEEGGGKQRRREEENISFLLSICIAPQHAHSAVVSAWAELGTQKGSATFQEDHPGKWVTQANGENSKCCTRNVATAGSELSLPGEWANTSQKWWHWWTWKNKEKRAFQAGRTASANLPRPDRIWNIWGITSRLVSVKDKDLCFGKIPWKLSKITGRRQGLKQKFFSFLLQKLLPSSE